MPPPSEVKYSEMTLSEDAITTIDYLHQIDKASALELLQNMLMKTSCNGYNKICMSMSKELDMPIKSIPSYYLAAKHCCKLIAGEVNYLNTHKHLLQKSASIVLK